MQLTILSVLITLLGLNASAAIGISPNHQVNPPHNFKQLICVERENRGMAGYTIIIDVPNGKDSEANVYFRRPGAPQVPVASWQVKYIVDPGVYVTFANQFQEMDISRGSEDLFSLNFQLHSGNGKNDTYEATFASPALLGFARTHYETRLNKKTMICKHQ